MKLCAYVAGRLGEVTADGKLTLGRVEREVLQQPVDHQIVVRGRVMRRVFRGDPESSESGGKEKEPKRESEKGGLHDRSGGKGERVEQKI